MAKISILLPFINENDVVKSTLNSLINQTYKDIEILCVNISLEESNLSSLKEYSTKYSNIKIISQKGLSSGESLNLALSKVNSKYLMFCNARDYFEPNMCEEMLNCIENINVDFVISDICIFEGDKDHEFTQPEIDWLYLKLNGYYNSTIEPKPYIYPTLYNKILRMDKIKQFNIEFSNELDVYNDFTFMYCYFAVSNNFYALNKKLYNRGLFSDLVRYNSDYNEQHCFQYIKSLVFGVKFFHRHQCLDQNLWIFTKLNSHIKKHYDELILSDNLENLLQNTIELLPKNQSYYVYICQLFKNIPKPNFANNKNAIVFYIDDDCAPNLGLALNSLIKNTTENEFYDINILHTEFKNIYITELKKLQRDNVCIHFISLNKYLIDISVNSTIQSTNYIYFTQEIFKSYDKVCYFDSNLIFVDDVSKIFLEDLDGKSMGAVESFYSQAQCDSNEIKNKFINPAVLLFDMNMINKIDFLNECISNQDNINANNVIPALKSDDIQLLNNKWNLQLPSENDSNNNFNFTFASYFNENKNNLCILNYHSTERLFRYNDDSNFQELINNVYDNHFYETLIYKNFEKVNDIYTPFNIIQTQQNSNTIHKINIPIAFASDNNYAPYLGVLLKSILEHSLPDEFYEFLILETNISDEYKEKMNLILYEHNNAIIKFINMSKYVDNINFHITEYYTPETYYRLFAQNIFNEYDKVLYIDVDTIVNANLRKLYETDVSDYILAACLNFITIQHVAYNKPLDIGPFGDYINNVLQLKNPYNYFQAGVLIFNIENMNKHDLQSKALQKLKEIEPRFVDQDILNIVCEGKVKQLSLQWNLFSYFSGLYGADYWSLGCKPTDFEDFKTALNKPNLIHFAGTDKRPWKNPLVPYADIWWKHARRTPFYEDIIRNNAQNVK